MIYETKRLIVRKPLLKDGESLHKMLHDPEILKYNCMVPTTLEIVKENLLKPSDIYEQYVIELKERHTVIGVVDLGPDTLRHGVNSKTISYYLDTDFTNQGYMSEALRGAIEYCFIVRGFDLLSARVFSPNVKSNRLLKHLGFTLEGTLFHAVKAYQNIIYDDNLYRMTKEEYLAIKNK